MATCQPTDRSGRRREARCCQSAQVCPVRHAVMFLEPPCPLANGNACMHHAACLCVGLAGRRSRPPTPPAGRTTTDTEPCSERSGAHAEAGCCGFYLWIFILFLTLFKLILNLTLFYFFSPKLALLAASISLARRNACAAPCMVA